MFAGGLRWLLELNPPPLALVGIGLTAAAQGDTPTVGKMLKQGNKSGEASALASNDWRVMELREASYV